MKSSDNIARLVVHPVQNLSADSLRLFASLLEGDGTSQNLWLEIPIACADAITPSADPWVVGLIFPIMQRERPVHVEGCVSPSLLENLEYFMNI